jgi:uncharacterized protein (TIGR00251 family)
MVNLTIQESDNGVIFTAKIVPGSSKTAVCGLFNGMLKVKVSAAPEKGKANQCLVEFLANQLGVKKNAIHVISGQTGRVKRLQVSGISAVMLLKKLSLNG